MLDRIGFSLLILLGLTSVAHAQTLGQQSLSQSSYVIDKNGRLFAFGWNWAGQLGVGDKTDRNTPVEVPIPSGATRWTLVAAGATHAIALADSDKLYAWGSNRYGQLGTGTLGEVVVPMRVANPPGVTAWKWVTAGRDHSLALTSTGQLYAWGNNVDGQLGTGNRFMATTPQPVQRANGVNVWAEVAAGPGYTLAVSSGGQLFGWGVDSIGSCQATAPTRASDHIYRALTPLNALSAGNDWEAAIADDGHFADGNNEPGDTVQWAEATSGGFHALGIKTSGELHAIGKNNHGQLGLGDTIDRVFIQRLSPEIPQLRIARPSGVSQWVGIAGGKYHSLALGNDGWLYAWGDNSKGELGIGVSADKWSPARVMQVGYALAIRGSFTGPVVVDGLPFSVTLYVTNVSPSLTLTNGATDMVPSAYIYLNDSGMHESLAPGTLVPLASNSATWQLIGVQYLSSGVDQTQFRFFSFVRANGSAPLLVQGSVILNSKPLREWATTRVLDSITMAPVPHASIYFDPAGGNAHDTMQSGDDGTLNMFFTQAGSYDPFVVKENYMTNNFAFDAPPDGDSIPTILLGPAPVIGTFAQASGLDPSMEITSFYYPDSLIGFAIGRNVIWRTMDSGAHWSAVYVSTSNNDLRAIRFANVRLGVAVGDAGEMVVTSDSGNTWTEVPPITAHDLHAVAFSERDTAWAVGDSGTVLKGSGSTWSAVNFHVSKSLRAIHFLDATHGAIVGSGQYFLYDGQSWTAGYVVAFSDLRAVYYASPIHLYIGGHGTNTFDLLSPSYNNLLLGTGPTNSLYFLNENIGFAAADSGGSRVTYDGGLTWAPLEEVQGSATPINFYSLNGGLLTNGHLHRFNGHPASVNAIVRGHVVSGDRETGIRGARITRTFSVKTGLTLDSVWTNELGNFVFAPITDTFHYDYKLYYTDSGTAKTHTWPSVSAKPGQIVTLNFLDWTAPPPPPPDTQHASVAQAASLASNLTIERGEGGSLDAVFSLQKQEQADIEIFDVMGRSMQRIASGIYGAGTHDAAISTTSLLSGTYYVRMITSEGELIRGFALISN